MNQHITITPCLSAATESTSHQFAFPNSQKNYVVGSQANIRVPMRAIHLADTPEHLGGGRNEPVLVYDTSGAYTDPEVSIDLQQGLPALRAASCISSTACRCSRVVRCISFRASACAPLSSGAYCGCRLSFIRPSFRPSQPPSGGCELKPHL